jgi:alanine racemase
MEVAILNIGYADGYLRCFSGIGSARLGNRALPVLGRISMDLAAVCVDGVREIAEGDWLELEFHLPTASSQSSLSQYELLTTLGSRFLRQCR